MLVFALTLRAFSYLHVGSVVVGAWWVGAAGWQHKSAMSQLETLRGSVRKATMHEGRLRKQLQVKERELQVLPPPPPTHTPTPTPKSTATTTEPGFTWLPPGSNHHTDDSACLSVCTCAACVVQRLWSTSDVSRDDEPSISGAPS